jgi:hypothetical protein
MFMAEGETDLEAARLKAEGLERWFRQRLSRGLTRLLVGLIILGGLISTYFPPVLVTGSICLSVAVVIAGVMTVRTLVILRQLRRNPEQAVARLTKWRQLKKAGFTPVA